LNLNRTLLASISSLALVAGFVISTPAAATTECSPTITTDWFDGAQYEVAVFPAGNCSWVVPARVTEVDVLVVGAGGGGGGGAAWDAGAHPGGGGGGGGVTTSFDISVTPGETASVVVGAGGAAGAGGVSDGPGQNGSLGGNSSITIAGSPVTALGGSGGQGGNGGAGNGGASATHVGGPGSGTQAGSGASSTTDGGPSLDPTQGTTLTFTGTSVVYGSGGGGAANATWPSDRILTGSLLNGAGGFGGRGGQNIYDYGYGPIMPGADGVVVVRWVGVGPDAPTDLEAEFVGDDVVLTWTAPAFVGSRPILGYRIMVDDGTGFTALTSPITDNQDTTYTATGLDRDGSYVFRLYAQTQSDYSPYVESGVITAEPTPVPYDGPSVTGGAVTAVSGSTVTFSGARLSEVLSATIGGQSAAVVSKSSSGLTLRVPNGLADGQYDVVLNFGDTESITLQNALKIQNSAAYWTRKQDDGSVKMYAKNIVGQGKVQFFHNSREIAWVRASDSLNPKLRTANGASYLVRTVELRPGKNRLEIRLNGETVREVTYTSKG
jgi:hypothetical protein